MIERLIPEYIDHDNILVFIDMMNSLVRTFALTTLNILR
jgi:hypothetical protein